MSQGAHAEMGNAMTWVQALSLRTAADPDMYPVWPLQHPPLVW